MAHARAAARFSRGPMSSAHSAGPTVVTQLQEAVVSMTSTRIAKIGTVVVPVTDQDRALAFYVDTLGFEKRMDVPFGPGYRWVEVAPAGADTTIAIVLPPEGKPAGDRETGIALNTDDIDALHAELKAGRGAGAAPAPPPGRGGPPPALCPRPPPPPPPPPRAPPGAPP